MKFMSKKICALLFVLVMLLSVLPIRGEAAQIVESEVEYLPDGSYIETVIYESVSRASGTKTGSKWKKYYD